MLPQQHTALSRVFRCGLPPSETKQLPLHRCTVSVMDASYSGPCMRPRTAASCCFNANQLAASGAGGGSGDAVRRSADSLRFISHNPPQSPPRSPAPLLPAFPLTNSQDDAGRAAVACPTARSILSPASGRRQLHSICLGMFRICVLALGHMADVPSAVFQPMSRRLLCRKASEPVSAPSFWIRLGKEQHSRGRLCRCQSPQAVRSLPLYIFLYSPTGLLVLVPPTGPLIAFVWLPSQHSPVGADAMPFCPMVECLCHCFLSVQQIS